MLFYCYSELCHVHHECDCGSKCCMGFFYSPKVFDVTNDLDLTQKEKEDLVYHHLCPHCNGWCEA